MGCVVSVMSVPSQHFIDLYAADPDPWRIGTGWYESRKRSLVSALLPAHHYRLGLEPACGNGDLTEILRQRCDRLIAWDVADAAVATARTRFANDRTVEVEGGRLPDHWPAVQGADLLVISEIGYYLDDVDLDLFLAGADAVLAPGATVLAVHWQHPVEGCPQTGLRVHHRLRARPGWFPFAEYSDDDLRIDVLIVGDTAAPSVAQQAGLTS